MKKVIIYTMQACPYCQRAKALLEEKGVPYEEICIDGSPELAREAVSASGGRTTVPQILIGGRPIGGCDDLYALAEDNRLDALLAD